MLMKQNVNNDVTKDSPILFAAFTLKRESRLRRVSLPTVKSGRDVFLTENSFNITHRFTRRYRQER